MCVRVYYFSSTSQTIAAKFCYKAVLLYLIWRKTVNAEPIFPAPTCCVCFLEAAEDRSSPRAHVRFPLGSAPLWGCLTAVGRSSKQSKYLVKSAISQALLWNITFMHLPCKHTRITLEIVSWCFDIPTLI